MEFLNRQLVLMNVLILMSTPSAEAGSRLIVFFLSSVITLCFCHAWPVQYNVSPSTACPSASIFLWLCGLGKSRLARHPALPSPCDTALI